MQFNLEKCKSFYDLDAGRQQSIESSLRGMTSSELEQLSVDAAALIKASTQRLERQRDAGFFQRIWMRLSGESGRIERANSADIIACQTKAWQAIGYLVSKQCELGLDLTCMQKELEAVSQSFLSVKNLLTAYAKNFHQRISQEEAKNTVVFWEKKINNNTNLHRNFPCLYAVELAFLAQKELRRNQHSVADVHEELEITIRSLLGENQKIKLSMKEFISRLIKEVHKTDSGDFHKRISSISNYRFRRKDIYDNVQSAPLIALYCIDEQFAPNQEKPGILVRIIRFFYPMYGIEGQVLKRFHRKSWTKNKQKKIYLSNFVMEMIAGLDLLVKIKMSGASSSRNAYRVGAAVNSPVPGLPGDCTSQNLSPEIPDFLHDEKLRQQALDSATEVRRWGDPVTLPPMNSHDRQIIHVTLENAPDLAIESVGEGAVKSVVISLKKEDPGEGTDKWIRQ